MAFNKLFVVFWVGYSTSFNQLFKWLAIAIDNWKNWRIAKQLMGFKKDVQRCITPFRMCLPSTSLSGRMWHLIASLPAQNCLQTSILCSSQQGLGCLLADPQPIPWREWHLSLNRTWQWEVTPWTMVISWCPTARIESQRLNHPQNAEKTWRSCPGEWHPSRPCSCPARLLFWRSEV